MSDNCRDRDRVQQARSDRELLQAARELWEKRNQELDADE